MTDQPPEEAYAPLFRDMEARLAPTCAGPDRWYIVVLAALVAGPDPEAVAYLYSHLCAQPRYATSEARQALVRRLREALVKAVSIVGVCKPLEAVLAIARRERPADRDYSATREGWQCDDANLARGMAWMGKIYTHNTDSTLDLYAAHRDFVWISRHITYGLYLGDRAVLDDLATELVVFPAIMAQNLPTETWWHIRGTRRIGVSRADTQALWDAVVDVCAHNGVRLTRVPTVEQVESDV